MHFHFFIAWSFQQVSIFDIKLLPQSWYCPSTLRWFCLSTYTFAARLLSFKKNKRSDFLIHLDNIFRAPLEKYCITCTIDFSIHLQTAQCVQVNLFFWAVSVHYTRIFTRSPIQSEYYFLIRNLVCTFFF